MNALPPASFDPQPVPAPAPPRRSPAPASPVFPGATSMAQMGFEKLREGIPFRESHDAEAPAISREGFVPADVANQKLWRVTTEYENLLALQKDHQGLVARRREAELAHLRAVAAMLSGEGGEEEDTAAARMQAQEQEAALTMQAKQAELALLAAVLALRDRQASDLRSMCEAKRARIKHLQSGGPAPKVAGDSWADVERLRSQVTELEVAVTGKQKELRGLASTLELRTQRAAELQAEVAEAERELALLAGAPSPAPAAAHDTPVIGRAGREEQAPASSMPAQGSLQARIEATRAQMAEAQQALGHMVRSNAHNDRLVRQMTGAVSVSDLGTSCEEDIVPESSSFVAMSDVQMAKSEPLVTPTALLPDSLEQVSEVASVSSPAPASPVGPLQAPLSQAPPPPSPVPEAPAVAIALDTEVAAAPLSHPQIEGSERASSPPSPHPDIDEPWHAYKPHPGDPIDAKVAQFVNQPRNRLRRALFSRLREGEYLYGTRRAQLRLSQGVEKSHLEARETSPEEEHAGDRCAENSTWAPVEEFARRLERSQSNRLRRARDRARWVAGTI
mmetsp:Transcript_101945/g.186761  ORF Transcript_101945/g.186761 Transcript_101945/m.186761 type:complete len:563 (+) Transcript_101945:2-1690(+)